MAKSIDEILDYIRGHRCFSHPIFEHWAHGDPQPETIGALFHQIQCFCASTRPGWNFPQALAHHNLTAQSHLLQEIVESESNHGPELAMMAGHVINRRSSRRIASDLKDHEKVEGQLRACSDQLLGTLPGYDKATGLTRQTRKAIAVFDRRKLMDRTSTLQNLGTALALELISNEHLIPGEKLCLLDSGLYGVSLDEPEMHYLLEHWGEVGAEQQHQKNAIAAVSMVLDDTTEPLIFDGVNEFLTSLVSLWDLLDSALLMSGYREAA